MLLPRLVIGVTLLTVPLFAYAGIFSFISGFLGGSAKADAQPIVNSQNMALLQAPVTSDPMHLAKVGGDIALADGGTALVPESGPAGSSGNLSDVASHGGISVYTVHQGDTLSAIAKMFGVSVNTIIWSNDIQRGLIHEGQTLVILPISGVQHTVKKGDTIASIAKYYKADAGEIIQYNGLTPGQALTVGSIVMVPDGELAPSVSSGSTVFGSNPVHNTGGFNLGDGFFLRPIDGGVRTQGLHGYNGVDLASYAGAPIYASAPGVVIVARMGGWNGGYGNYVVIDHEIGVQTLYAHMSSVIVSSGQSVTRGQVIGYEGRTGKATGVHLHFEVRGARNPFGY